jgi:hypothetical protein
MMKNARQGMAAFCLGLFLAVYAMAAMPALHQWAHADAGDARHECAATLFAHGQVHGANAAVEWRQPAPLLLSSTLPPAAPFRSTDVRSFPSRGPPSALLFL